MKRRPHKIVSVVLLVILIAGMGMACRIQSLESRNKRWTENTETAGKILTESGKKEAQKQTNGTENDDAAQNAKRVFGDEPAELYARSAVLMDADSGRVLFGKDTDVVRPMASTTKIMTCILALESLREHPDQTIEVSDQAASQPKVHLGMQKGEVFYIKDLLYSLMLESHNDSAVAVAEGIAGSVEEFAKEMNAKAAEIGCKNTHFANTTGLTQSGHYSCAYDLYLITREAMTFEDFMTMVNTKSYEIPPTNKTEEERVLHSTNALISNWRMTGYLYSGAQGIKTGSTDAAGQCLVSSAVRGSRTLISVVLGAEKVEKENGSGYIVESFTETARLFDWGFDNFSSRQVLDENELVQEVPVALSKQVSTVAVHPAQSAEAMLPKDLDVESLTRTVTLDNETALAPIAAGDRLGEITVSYGDTEYVTVPLLAVADVSASRFLLARHAVGEFFSRPSIRIAAIALLVLIVALVLWFRFYGRNRRYGKAGSKQYRHRSYHGRRH